jgi:hypothetical protein
MSWTPKQRSIAAAACRMAGMAEEHRKLLLRQLDSSMYDENGRPSDEPSSRSRHLSQADFEQFMATVELAAGGKLARTSHGYWAGKARDSLSRMRGYALGIAQQIEAAGVEVRLGGWIRNRVAHGRTDQIGDLDYHELRILIESLRAFARRHFIKLVSERAAADRGPGTTPEPEPAAEQPVGAAAPGGEIPF